MKGVQMYTSTFVVLMCCESPVAKITLFTKDAVAIHPLLKNPGDQFPVAATAAHAHGCVVQSLPFVS